jgi:hypothetical protein
MIGPKANRLLDRLHHATVAVLAVSTLYFGVEAFRATWAIQKSKYEGRKVWVVVCVGTGHAHVLFAAGRWRRGSHDDHTHVHRATLLLLLVRNDTTPTRALLLCCMQAGVAAEQQQQQQPQSPQQ